METRAADIVITDLYMPVKEGIETIVALRKRFHRTRIIAMSGGGYVRNMQIPETTQKLGASRVLHKPITMQALNEAVRGVLADEPAAAASPAE